MHPGRAASGKKFVGGGWVACAELHLTCSNVAGTESTGVGGIWLTDDTWTLALAELTCGGDQKPFADPNCKGCMITASGVRRIDTEHPIGGDHNASAEPNTRCCQKSCTDSAETDIGFGREACTDSTLGAVHKFHAEHSIGCAEFTSKHGALGSDRRPRAGINSDSCTDGVGHTAGSEHTVSGREVGIRVGHRNGAGIKHCHTAADFSSQSHNKLAGDTVNSIVVGLGAHSPSNTARDSAGNNLASADLGSRVCVVIGRKEPTGHHTGSNGDRTARHSPDLSRSSLKRNTHGTRSFATEPAIPVVGNATGDDPVGSTHDVENVQQAPTRAQHNLACITVASTDYTVGGTAGVGSESQSKLVGDTAVFAGLGSHGHNCTVGDPVDSTHGVGNGWRAPTRTQHSPACSTVTASEYTVVGAADVNLACSTVAGTEYTVGGAADVNLACSTRIGRKVCTDSTLGAIHKLCAERSISGVEVVAHDDAVDSDQ
jgi:hypothetical protein